VNFILVLAKSNLEVVRLVGAKLLDPMQKGSRIREPFTNFQSDVRDVLKGETILQHPGLFAGLLATLCPAALHRISDRLTPLGA